MFRVIGSSNNRNSNPDHHLRRSLLIFSGLPTYITIITVSARHYLWRDRFDATRITGSTTSSKQTHYSRHEEERKQVLLEQQQQDRHPHYQSSVIRGTDYVKHCRHHCQFESTGILVPSFQTAYDRYRITIIISTITPMIGNKTLNGVTFLPTTQVAAAPSTLDEKNDRHTRSWDSGRKTTKAEQQIRIRIQLPRIPSRPPFATWPRSTTQTSIPTTVLGRNAKH